MKTSTQRGAVVFWGVFIGALLAASWPLMAPRPQSASVVAEFGRLPILEGGRVKPMDSFARTSLLMIRGTQTLPSRGHSVSATQWLLDVLFHPETADAYKVFTIDDPDLLGLLKLDGQHERRFAYWQIDPQSLEEVRGQAARAEAIDPGRRSHFQTATINLNERLKLYEQIKNTLLIPGGGNPVAELEAFVQSAPGALRAIHHKGRISSRDQAALKTFMGMSERYRALGDAAAFRPLAPLVGQSDDAWASYGEGVLIPTPDAHLHPALMAYARMAQSYRMSDMMNFSAAVKELSEWFTRQRPTDARRAEEEVAFNSSQPFISGMALYLAALLAVFACWATKSSDARSAALSLLTAAFVVHTAGLAARIILQGRPPVTNLYSSAVFVGWVAAGLGLAAERAHKKGFAAAGGAAVGFCTLLIAHHLTASGDTMEMMRAVLDSNFWLATHVVTVTMGYGATFLAGALGIAWVLRRQFLANPDPQTTKIVADVLDQRLNAIMSGVCSANTCS